MRIGIDVYSYDKPGDNYGVGPGVYVWKILPELVALCPNDVFIIFGNNDNYDLIPNAKNVELVINPLNSKFRPYRILHEQIFIPFQFVKLKLDFVHFLGNNISYLISNKSILTVYDLMWKYYLDRGNKEAKYKYFNYTIPRSITSVKAVITISKFIADEVNVLYRSTIGNTFPILLASGNSLKDIDKNEISNFKLKYPFQFLFSVTTSMPHKNLMVLLNAFKKIKDESTFDGKLIIAGQLKGEFYKITEYFIKENKLDEAIILAGFISEEEKLYCYKNTLMVIYPSLYEGFGLPVLEAMELGVPIVASNAASIPEVGGEAAIYFDPNSPIDLATKIILLLENQNLRTEMIEKGYKQFKEFTWRKTALKTVEIYKYLFY